MKIIGVIPARYASTRFPGKPLAEIKGHPMIWWVYQRAKQVEEFSEIFVATDDTRIANICQLYNIPYIMTSENAPNHIYRIWEVSEQVKSDIYVSVNGDEPLIQSDNIKKAIESIPQRLSKDPYFGSVYREMTDPTEVIDISNVKIVLGMNNQCLYQSRNPIPSTKGSIEFKYKKAIGIECFNKSALDFFVNTKMGVLERIEDIDHLRFIENGIPIYYTQIYSDSLSVDTKKDLERVRRLFEKDSEIGVDDE